MNTILTRMRRVALVALVVSSSFVLEGCQASSIDAVTRDYRSLLIVSQLNASYYTEPKTKVKYALVKGSLSNLGPKSLIVVEFTVRFKDKTRNVIWEEHAFPVYVSIFSFPEPSEVLKPGAKTRFAFKVPKCPPQWEPGAVDVEITKVVLSTSV